MVGYVEVPGKAQRRVTLKAPKSLKSNLGMATACISPFGSDKVSKNRCS